MPTFAAANQMLSNLNSTQNENRLSATAEIPITSSGVRIASPTSRLSTHSPPSSLGPFINHQNHNQNHRQQSPPSSSSFPLPNRAPHRRSTRSSSSFWRTFFSLCIAEETERTIACTDRVIYRPTADDDHQVVTTSNNSRRNRRSNKMACCSGQSSSSYRQCLQRLAILLVLLILASVILEMIHIFTDTCKCIQGKMFKINMIILLQATPLVGNHG